MMRRAWPVLLLAVMALGWDGGARAEARKRANRCYGVRVYGVKPSADAPDSRQRRRFSVRKVDALEFRVRLPARRPGSHRVRLEVYTPNGDLYQTLTAIHASPGDDASPTPRRRRRRRWEYVTLRLPVAATTIVRSSLYGRWRVKAYLDGASRPCGRRRFAIRP